MCVVIVECILSVLVVICDRCVGGSIECVYLSYVCSNSCVYITCVVIVVFILGVW